MQLSEQKTTGECINNTDYYCDENTSDYFDDTDINDSSDSVEYKQVSINNISFNLY